MFFCNTRGRSSVKVMGVVLSEVALEVMMTRSTNWKLLVSCLLFYTTELSTCLNIVLRDKGLEEEELAP